MRSSKQRSRNKPNRNVRPTGGNIINRVFDSSGPDGKVRGTPAQIIEKYGQLHRDAQLSGDRVNAENFAQHAEHYTRILAEATREVDRAREEQEQFNRERQTERDRQIESQRDRDRERTARLRAQEDANGTADGGTVQLDRPVEHQQDRQPERQQERSNDRQSDRQPERQQDRQNDRQPERQNDRRQDRQNDRQPDRQNDRQPERQPEPQFRSQPEPRPQPREHDFADASFLSQPLFPTLASTPDADLDRDAGLVDTPEDRRAAPEQAAEPAFVRTERPRREDRWPRRDERRSTVESDAAPEVVAAPVVEAAPAPVVDEAPAVEKPRRARKPRVPRADVPAPTTDTVE